jgi:hypothetical protein
MEFRISRILILPFLNQTPFLIADGQETRQVTEGTKTLLSSDELHPEFASRLEETDRG